MATCINASMLLEGIKSNRKTSFFFRMIPYSLFTVPGCLKDDVGLDYVLWRKEEARGASEKGEKQTVYNR